MAHCAAGCLSCQSCRSRAVQETVYGRAPLRLHRPKAGRDLEAPEDPGCGMDSRCPGIEGCQAAFPDAELERSLPKQVYRALNQLRNLQSLVCSKILSRSALLASQLDPRPAYCQGGTTCEHRYKERTRPVSFWHEGYSTFPNEETSDWSSEKSA